MPNALVALGGSFLAAGLLARFGRRIGLPTIPLFMAAGILTGPHTPGLVLVRDHAELELFATFGLIFLLFQLGLEFSIDDLTRGGRRLLGAGGTYLLLNLGGGFLLGSLLGWGTREAFIIAGAVGISSSAIVTKLLVELRRLANRETPMILGIIVVEDVFLALYLAALQPILGRVRSPIEGVLVFARALAFLVALFVIARFAARWVGRIVTTEDDELLTVLFVGLVVLIAGAGEAFGVSEAIGALMTGLILARTSVAPRIQKLVLPLRDAFGAVFFFVFGLTIQPTSIRAVAGPVAIAVASTVVLNLIAGFIAAKLHGFDRHGAVNAGLTLLGRGEFSLILVTLAATAGLDPRLGPFVALYVLVLALGGPLLASRSDRIARLGRARREPIGPT